MLLTWVFLPILFINEPVLVQSAAQVTGPWNWEYVVENDTQFFHVEILFPVDTTEPAEFFRAIVP